MMDQCAITLWLAGIQRLLQRIEHEVGTHRRTDPPTHDVAAEHVNDEGAIDAQIRIPDPFNVRAQERVALCSGWQPQNVPPSGRVPPIARRGNLQRSADRLDPEALTMRVDEPNHFL